MSVEIINSDCLTALRTLPDESVHCCVTSPPYWGLRDYGVEGQLGREKTPTEYVAQMVAVFSEVRRVLRNDGTLWLNLGDSYATAGGSHRGRKDNQSGVGAKKVHEARAGDSGNRVAPQGLKAKDLIGIPWRVAFALQADGWYLREDIIWAKPNPMPESVTDRCTRSHEYLFHLSKSSRYYHNAGAIKEPAIGADRVRDDPIGGNKHTGKTTKHSDQGRFVQNKPDKQRGHSRRHEGFNDRWDQMSREEQCAGFRNKRSVWTVTPAVYPDAHFATFPPKLIEPCILAGCPVNGIVLDPFGGSGTTGQVAQALSRKAVLIELNPTYCDLIRKRLTQAPKLAQLGHELL